MPTQFGNFKVVGFYSEVDNKDYVALVKGKWSEDDEVKLMVEEYSDQLTLAVLANSLTFEKADVDHSAEFRTSEKDIWIGF